MKKVEKFYEISEQGEMLEPEWWKVLIGQDDISKELKRIIGFSWIYDGIQHEKRYAYGISPKLVGNGEGIMVVEEEPYQGARNSLVFYEPDGRERFRIRPSGMVGKGRDGEEAYFHHPAYDRERRVWEIYYNSGECDYCEYIADLDIETGRLSNIRKTRF